MKRTDITALFPDATDEQIKKLMDLNGADINNARRGVDDLQARISDLEKRPTADALTAAQKSADALQTELDSLKAANTLRDMRASVAKEKGVPAELITADTEESARAQADALITWKGDQPKYPATNDGGEVTHLTGGSTRDQFADWFPSAMQKGV